MKNPFVFFLFIVFFCILSTNSYSVNCFLDGVVSKTSFSKIPHLHKKGHATQLIVDNKPFLILGGELHNSSTSGFEYMRPIWRRMSEAGMNTVLAAVSWEQTEPLEGHFDFSLVDSMILGARKENLRLILLWFGSWKNGRSTYVPGWIKKNQERFPLAVDEHGKKLIILSTFSKEACDADTRAFTALMKHIREIDGKEQTVIMVQVQNEMGILWTKRDFSDAANAAYRGMVPAELMKYFRENKETLHPGVLEAWRKNGFRTKGTWEEVFGEGKLYENWKELSYLTEELFMAWNYAVYVGKIAAAGKAEYPLPMFINAHIKQPGNKGDVPGCYPSGGPTPQVIDVWRAAAPAIDFLSPDIYNIDEFRYECDQYVLSGNPLFIPETTKGAAGAARAFFTFGKYHAMGYSPFGIDGLDAGINCDETADFKDAYQTINQLVPLINNYQGTPNMTGLLVDEKNVRDTVHLGGLQIIGSLVKSSNNLRPNNSSTTGISDERHAGGALVICTAPGEYIIAGRGMRFEFQTLDIGLKQSTSFLHLEEGTIENGKWQPLRRLNGDEFKVILPPHKSIIYKTAVYTY